mmetsp:Transcript_8750/g.24133  ORF Transcript_8750/g.24133 Transcript_8750/m.24133 type:complete len:204 (-) Transcript_8750:159-770(-)
MPTSPLSPRSRRTTSACPWTAPTSLPLTAIKRSRSLASRSDVPRRAGGAHHVPPARPSALGPLTLARRRPSFCGWSAAGMCNTVHQQIEHAHKLLSPSPTPSATLSLPPVIGHSPRIRLRRRQDWRPRGRSRLASAAHRAVLQLSISPTPGLPFIDIVTCRATWRRHQTVPCALYERRRSSCVARLQHPGSPAQDASETRYGC